MTADEIFSAKKTGQSLDNNPATNEVHIKESNQNLIPPLSTNEHKQLRVNPRKWSACSNCCQEGFVLDGVPRYRACKELGISIKSITKQFKNPYQEKLFQIEVNLLRRQMTAFKRIEAGYSLEGATITGLTNGMERNPTLTKTKG